MIEIKDCIFSYSYTGKPTINDLSLNFKEGGIYGLLGENGVGKTTLLQLMVGLLTPLEGEVLCDGVNTRKRLPSTMSKLFLVPEEIEFPEIRLLSYANIYGKLYPNFSMDEFKRHLSTFEIAGNPKLSNLSMGQKKKIALAFAMACNTEVLLMDEPTNGLDIPGKAAFRKFVAESMREDRIFIISTHQIRDINTLLDHITIINNSEVLFNKSIWEIQSKLRFENTSDCNKIEDALYQIKGIGSSAVILSNNGEDETEVNLELLFSYATEDSASLNSQFTNKED